jgi:hypothetical protein
MIRPPVLDLLDAYLYGALFEITVPFWIPGAGCWLS